MGTLKIQVSEEFMMGTIKIWASEECMIGHVRRRLHDGSGEKKSAWYKPECIHGWGQTTKEKHCNKQEPFNYFLIIQ